MVLIRDLVRTVLHVSVFCGRLHYHSIIQGYDNDYIFLQSDLNCLYIYLLSIELYLCFENFFAEIDLIF